MVLAARGRASGRAPARLVLVYFNTQPNTPPGRRRVIQADQAAPAGRPGVCACIGRRVGGMRLRDKTLCSFFSLAPLAPAPLSFARAPPPSPPLECPQFAERAREHARRPAPEFRAALGENIVAQSRLMRPASSQLEPSDMHLVRNDLRLFIITRLIYGPAPSCHSFEVSSWRSSTRLQVGQ